MEILRFPRAADAPAAAALVPDLARVLQGCVDGGASVGFLPPLALGDAVQFWTNVVAAVASGEKSLLVARDGSQVLGTVQLVHAGMPNGRHRSELSKLLVSPAARRRGVGRALMAAAEEVARDLGRTLLVLDTERGSAAQTMYRELGWTEVGTIPAYALVPAGTCDTVIFYKQLA